MQELKILVRLPNWLGDMVMSVGFINSLQQVYPRAAISVVVKNGLQGLLPFFPPTEHVFIFDKKKYKGVGGAWRFGKVIKHTQKFDLFFCLPDSFSSALICFASGAKKTIGFKNEMRHFLLSHAYTKPSGLHRVDEYIALLEQFTKKTIISRNVTLAHNVRKEDYVVVNINSEASSRRLTEAKAVEILNFLKSSIPNKIYLIGAPKEEAFVHGVLKKLAGNNQVESLAGKTSLQQLATILAGAKAVLSTDSGPAHLANALGTFTLVLFGAGNENNTAPYNKQKVSVMRLNGLSCEPCQKNICVRFGVPQCLERLNTANIIEQLKTHINN